MVNLVTFPGLGLEISVDRVAFTLFGVDVYWYGIIIATGLLAGIAIGYWKAKAFGINEDRMTDVIIVTTILAVVCSRLYYVIFDEKQYTSFAEVLNVRDGGLAIYGAVLGAFFFGTLMCRLRKVPTLAMFDLTAIGFLAGQGIGRWGNFTNQEAFGCNTTLPWGMISENTQSYLATMQAHLAAQGIVVDPSQPVHPTFFYESFWCLLGMVLLLCYIKKRKFDGEILLMYIAWYGFERCIVEGLRTDSLMLGNVRISQLVAGVSCVAAVVVLLFARKKAKAKAAAGVPTLAVQRVQMAAEARTAALARYDAAKKAVDERTVPQDEAQKGSKNEQSDPD